MELGIGKWEWEIGAQAFRIRRQEGCGCRPFVDATGIDRGGSEMTNWILRAACLVLLLAGSPGAQEPGAIRSEVLARSGVSWNGAPLPDYPDGRPEITILRIEIPPQAQLPLHEHPVINAGVLLKGQLTVMTQDGKTLHLRAGDAIIEVVDTWHYGKNEGSETAEIIVFYAGAPGTPITVKK
jgi:quercetin dioxygenase-like cupin family protein